MAVTVASIAPADTATGIAANYPIVVNLTDGTDIDPDLVTVTVNGVACTVAGDNLEVWGFKKVSGGSIVTDYTDIYVATTEDWYERSGETITVTVEYTGSGTISTTTFTCRDHEFHAPGAGAYYWATTFQHLAGVVYGDLYYFILNLGTDRCSGDAYFYVEESITVSSDAYYYVAHLFSTVQKASGVVGELILTQQDASGVVQAYRRTSQPASGVVQGWFRRGQPVSGIVAIRFRYGQQLSGVVGVETLARVDASGVVYGVLKSGVLEIQVMDDATYTALTGLGVTWS